MAGKVDAVDAKFFEQEIVSQINGRQIEYLDEINHTPKTEPLGNAVITLLPIKWRESFGLVMIESMAISTTVIGMIPDALELD